MKNTVGLGASLALCDYPFDLVAEVITGQFKGKRSEIGQLNVRAAKLAFVLALMGHDDVAVYDGGWADWGSRLDLPVDR